MTMKTVSLPISNGHAFENRFAEGLRAAPVISTLQINIGYLCNLACRHCHVESSPKRTGKSENMTAETAQRIVEWALRQPTLDTVDLTGGSPEMNPNFRWIVQTFHQAGWKVMDRCNPTILNEIDPRTGQSFDWIPSFLADHAVEVVASLPCYLEDNVNRQRGKGAYDGSIEGLRKLNHVGYGHDPRLMLNLVFNPIGPSLPPPQEQLASDYRRELHQRFGLVFNELWTITNMPIKRWRHELERTGRLDEYMTLLVNSFNPNTVDGLMCRHQINVNPQGRLFDCDFNQAEEIEAPGFEGRFIWETSIDELASRVIGTADHCYGCTAGSGSSCGGVLV